MNIISDPFWGYQIPAQTNKDISIIFLHDALGCTGTWKDFPMLIHQNFDANIWVYDRLGHGKSNLRKPDSKIRYMHDEAEDLRRFITHHQIENPILIGSSDGGTISLLYASQYDTKAVVNLAGHYRIDEGTLVGVKESILKREKLIEKLSKYHGEKTRHLVENWQDSWTSDFFRYWNIGEDLRKITCPTLLVQGDNDEYANADHHLEIAEIMGKYAKVITLKDTGHFPHLERKELICKHIINFLTTVLPEHSLI